MAIELHGYKYSVYLRAARIVLAEKGVPYRRVEVNPFAENMPQSYLDLHPFGRVPALVHDEFVLYETVAITRYIDESFAGPELQPDEPRKRARMAQIISIVDSYAYWPMVRQLYVQRISGPRRGRQTDEEEVRRGIEGSDRALAALDAISSEGEQLAHGEPSLADFHLIPMMAYFTATEEGQDLLARYRSLSAWWDIIRYRPSLMDTDPGVPDGAES